MQALHKIGRVWCLLTLSVPAQDRDYKGERTGVPSSIPSWLLARSRVQIPTLNEIECSCTRINFYITLRVYGKWDTVNKQVSLIDGRVQEGTYKRHFHEYQLRLYPNPLSTYTKHFEIISPVLCSTRCCIILATGYTVFIVQVVMVTCHTVSYEAHIRNCFLPFIGYSPTSELCTIF